MVNKRFFKVILLVVVLILLLGYTSLCYLRENAAPPAHSCLGVPILQTHPGNRSQQDYYNQILFQGSRVALDRSSNTIYISQRISDQSMLSDLEGLLEINNPFCDLAFLADPMFDDLETAVSEGHRFTLFVNQPFGSYSEYNVIFTTFPVIRMDGAYSHSLENERKVYLGELILWNAEPMAKVYSTKASQSYWHIRGGITTDFPKTSWRVSLVDEYRKKNDVSFLGLDADDDWILNPMILDDSKMRDPYCMALWNSLTETAPWNYKMSSGGYTEVVMDGEYKGIFLLQRRIDAKYLGLNEETDILMKGKAPWKAEADGFPYDAETSFLSLEDSCAEVDKTIQGEKNTVNLPNFIDNSLMIQLALALDNCDIKNMFYLLTEQDGQHCLSWILWDMDYSFKSYGTDGLSDDVSGMAFRPEYAVLKERFPDLDIQLAKRWQELRSTTFSDENLSTLYWDLLEELTASGAFQRDLEKWGCMYGGTDSHERLIRWILNRTQLLDEYYADFLSA